MSALGRLLGDAHLSTSFEDIIPVLSQTQQAVETAFCCLADFEVKLNLY